MTKISIVKQRKQSDISKILILLDKLGIESKLRKVREKYYVITITNKKNIKKFLDKVGFIIKRKMEKPKIK